MIFSPRISVIMAAALMAAGCDSDLSNSVTNTNTATTDYDSTVTAPVSTSSRSTTTTTTHTSATPTTGGAWVIVLDDALTTGVTTGEAAGGEFTESGYFLLSGAYLHYDTPCQQAIRVEFDAMGFREDTAAEKLILLQVYDLPHDEAAWVGGSSAWMSGSLIELKQRDGDLRWRIGGRGGDEHFPTEYVAVGWQADAWYHFVMEWHHGVLTVWRNEEQLLSIASDTFAPQDTLRVRLGGSPFDAGVAGVTLRNVIISGIAAS